MILQIVANLGAVDKGTDTEVLERSATCDTRKSKDLNGAY